MAVPKSMTLPDPSRLSIGPDLKRYLADVNTAIRNWAQAVTTELSGNTDAGTLVVDDGTTRLTVIVSKGRISSVTTGASTGSGLTWT
jgi:hypothetical protein